MLSSKRSRFVGNVAFAKVPESTIIDVRVSNKASMRGFYVKMDLQSVPRV